MNESENQQVMKGNSAKESEGSSFLAIAFSRPVVLSSIKVALVVGTLLAFINNYDKLATLNFKSSDLFKMILTYLVPYGVSTWSAVKAIQANSNSSSKD